MSKREANFDWAIAIRSMTEDQLVEAIERLEDVAVYYWDPQDHNPNKCEKREPRCDHCAALGGYENARQLEFDSRDVEDTWGGGPEFTRMGVGYRDDGTCLDCAFARKGESVRHEYEFRSPMWQEEHLPPPPGRDSNCICPLGTTYPSCPARNH